MESQQLMLRIDELVREIETLDDPHARACAVELVQSLMEFHGAGLQRMLELVAATGAPGEAVIESFADDELVGGLLLLYGLHPLELDARVRRALDAVRPSLAAQGGEVELIGINEGVARVRAHGGGGGHGCPSTATTLRQTIEAAIYDAAPDLVALEVEGLDEQPTAPAGLVQLGRIKSEGRTA